MVVGMSSAILQGVPATTLDTDLWIDLPERQYMRPVNLGLSIGATMIRNTVIALRDGLLVNFVFGVTGLAGFATEWRRAKEIKFLGEPLKVLPLEQLIRSKEVIRRPKDLAHLELLRNIVEGRRIIDTRD
jgi:hypothetical protein